MSTATEDDLLLASVITPARPGFRSFGWKAVAGAVVSLLIVTAVMLPGSLVFSALALPIAVVGAGYALVVLPTTLLRWRAAGQVVADADDDELRLVERFETPSQRLTLVLSGVLLVNLVLAAILAVAGPAGTVAAWLFIFVGLVAQIAGLASAWANARWLYSPSYLLGEHRALRDRRDAWKLILANRVLTVAMWLGYVTGAIVYCAIAL